MDATEHRAKISKILVEHFKCIYNINYSNILSVREIIDSIDDQVNKDYHNDNIVEKEYLVKNPNDKYEIPVSVYIPKNVSSNSAIVIMCHGGGFMFFTRKTFKRQTSNISEHSNKIWVSIEYRKSPEFKYPTAIEDCMTVVEWINNYKAQLFNSNQNVKIGVCGYGNGGYLAACLAQRMKHLVSFQILVFPWLNLSYNRASFYKTQSHIEYNFFESGVNNYLKYPEQGNLAEVSPLINDDLVDLPKCLIISGELDPFVGDSYAYHKKLLDNNLNSKLHVVRGSISRLFNPYFGTMDAAFDVFNEILSFTKQF